MERCPGWILDLYPTPTGMAVWIVGQDGNRRCYFDNQFRPAFYVRGPLGELRGLGRDLPARFRGLRATCCRPGRGCFLRTRRV